MKEYFVTFRSITFAQRGQNVLRSAGVPVQLQRTPRWMEEKGCGIQPARAPRIRGCCHGTAEAVWSSLQQALSAPG